MAENLNCMTTACENLLCQIFKTISSNSLGARIRSLICRQTDKSHKTFLLFFFLCMGARVCVCKEGQKFGKGVEKSHYALFYGTIPA
jgi:hypothetical protein